MEVTLETGADDLIATGDSFEIRSQPDQFSLIKAALEEAKVPLVGGEVAYVAKNHAAIDDVELARKVLRLLDALDEQDDVQSVYANYQFSDAVSRTLSEQ